ncbi:MAG: aminopeptidase [Tissierellia bacterium]|nr:aminopeptidase [Tissierellia bacterium]
MQYKRKNVWENLDEKELLELEKYSKEYIDFLSSSKTERLAVKEIRRMAEECGYKDISVYLQQGKIKKGDKVYQVNKEKGVVLAVIGEDIEKGMHIVGSHIDSPRLDLKQVPVMEKNNMAFFKTHYYGGIKKYQWTAIPLALHGVIFNKNNEKIEISVGEDENDPIFYVTDLLPHLAADQMKNAASEFIKGEQLNIIIGHDSSNSDAESEKVKSNILKILKEKYNIDEEDFVVAEIEAVPAGRAREVGFDRSMIAGHGHDDRVCSYANLKAMLEVENPEITAIGLFVDKEEIGSVGNTGMTSKFFENFVYELIHLLGKNDLVFRRAMANSKVLSADVNAAIDPSFTEVLEDSNACHMGCGVGIAKYTGVRGKSGTNDANAEFVQEIRQLFNKNNVIWQTGELGKVDQGGGGTIAFILAEYGMEVLDVGTGMLSMHAPIELVSKADAYMTYKGYKAFLQQ